MVKIILNGILGMLQGILNIILSPLNALVSNLIPDFSDAVNLFNAFVSQYIGSGLGYFTSILPPITKNIIGIFLVFIITYYTIAFSYIGIIKLFNIIQKIKFW